MAHDLPPSMHPVCFSEALRFKSTLPLRARREQSWKTVLGYGEKPLTPAENSEHYMYRKKRAEEEEQEAIGLVKQLSLVQF